MNLDVLKKKIAALSFKDAIKEYGLDFLLYFTCCLPFLRTLPIPSDVQPYAFITAVVYLIVRRRSILLPNFHTGTFCLFLFAAFVAIADIVFNQSLSFMTLARKTYNYAALFVISLALFNSMQRTGGIKENWIKGFILLWLFVGVVQLLFDRQFMGFLVSNFRTTPNRGISGLASEPSFYGYVVMFFFVLANEFKRNRRIYQGICLFQIVVLAQSAVTLVYLAVFALMYLVQEIVYFKNNSPKQKKVKLIIAGSAVVLIAATLFVLTKTMWDSRMVQVFTRLFRNIWNVRSMADLYAVDVSVAQRVEAIVFSFQGFFEAWGLPHGYGEVVIGDIVRIMSGFGSLIYELGLPGMILAVAICLPLVRGLKNGFVFGGGLAIIMFSSIQIGSPVFVFVLATALYSGGRAKSIPLNRKAIYQLFPLSLLKKSEDKK